MALIVVGYPLFTEEELAEYHNPHIEGPMIRSGERDIPALLVEQGFFASKNLARKGTPPEMHRIYGPDELDVIEWRRKHPWPLYVTIIVGCASEFLREARLPWRVRRLQAVRSGW